MGRHKIIINAHYEFFEKASPACRSLYDAVTLFPLQYSNHAIISEGRMKKTHAFALGIAVVLLLVNGNIEARAPGCDPIGNVRFICDQVGPEDLVVMRA